MAKQKKPIPHDICLIKIRDVLKTPGARNKPLLRSCLYHMTADTAEGAVPPGGTAATREELAYAHRLAFKLLTRQAERFLNGEVVDADGMPIEPPGHVLANLTAFLRAAGATTPATGKTKAAALPAGVLDEIGGWLSEEDKP